MSARMFGIVLGALVALSALYGIVLWVGSWEAPAGEGETVLAEVLAQGGSGSVESIEIAGGAEPIVLQRTSTGWTVNGFPADTLAVRRLLGAMTNVSLEGPVSSNPENHARLGVAGTDALQLRFTAEGGPPATLTVGNRGPLNTTTYVRLPTSDEVFLLQSELRAAAERSGVGDWRDRTVTRVDTAQVSRFAVERDGRWTEILRADTAWTVEGQPAEALTVRNVLGGLESLIAVDFAPDSVSLDTVTRRVVVLGAQGDTLAAIEMGEARNAGLVPTRVPGVAGILELTAFQAERIAPTHVAFTGGLDQGSR